MLPATPQRTAERRWVAPGSEHRARDHVRRRQRIAVLRCGVDRRTGCAWAAKPALRLHLVEPLAERPHDPPAAHVRAGGDRKARRRTSPRWDLERRRGSRSQNSASAITPIVFCASFAPCVNATNVPDASWPRPKAAVADAAGQPPEHPVDDDQQRKAHRMRARARSVPGSRHCGQARATSTPSSPDCASAAPTRPPIRACDELEGSPNHQVSRFQAIAPR